MSKVIRYIDTTETGEADRWHPEGLLPTHIRRSEHLGIKMEKIPVSFLLDEEIAKEPWIVEISLSAGKGHMDLLGENGGFWLSVPALVKKRLRQGYGTLILNYYLEGMTGHVLEMIYRYFDKYPDIPRKQTIYLTSAMHVKEDHARWCEQHNIPKEKQMQCWGTNAWEWTCGVYSFNRTQNEPVAREKKYLFLNRRLRPHRVLFPCLFASAGILDKGLVSYFADDDMGDTILANHRRLLGILDRYPDTKERYLKGYEITTPNLPYIVDTTDYKFNHAVTMAESLYERTYFSVVSETFFIANGYGDSVFFSEKAFKPMSQLHPFIMIGRPGSLNTLRLLGYKTFAKWFDESYDLIEDDILRAEAVTKEVTRLASLSDQQWCEIIREMQPVLLHNQERLRRSAEEIFNKTDLRKLLKYQTEARFLIHEKNLGQYKLPYPVLVKHEDQDPWLLKLLEWEDTYHARQTLNEVQHYRHPWFYLLEIKTGHDQIWEQIPDEAKRHILTGKAYLLLSNIHEGETSLLFSKIHEMLKNEPALSPYKVVLLSGAANVDCEYHKFATERHLPKIHVCYVNLFESRTREAWTQIHKNARQLSFLNKTPRAKKFVCFNRQPKFHRIAFLGMLEERGLLDAGYVSCHLGMNAEQQEWALANLRRAYREGYCSQAAAAKLKTRLPMILDSSDVSSFPTYGFAKEYYEHSYFSVVSETFSIPKAYELTFTDCTIFPTEKIYKPILLGHPFIVVSTPHFLKTLRSQGYETFPDIFDETYDEIEDHQERLRFVADEVARLSSLNHNNLMRLTTNVRSKLVHNQRLLLEKHPQNELVDFLNRLANG